MSTPNEKKDLLVMKLLHYFITERNYNPVVVHGIQNEIWLENMDSDIRIVRLVLNYIHNDEQLDFDKFKLGRLSRQIKLKTFTIKMKTMSFYLDLNEDVKLVNDKNNFAIRVDKEKDLSKDEMVNKYLPEYKSLYEMKAHYEKGGLGDVKCKKLLINVLEEVLEPIRERRKYYEERIDEVYNILKEGTRKANQKANATLARVRKAMRINYFEDPDFIKNFKDKNNY